MRGGSTVKTLVLGGIRSGKSAVAERLVQTAQKSTAVTYIATGPTFDDDDWAQRLAAHRARRPASWGTIETIELPATIGALRGPAIIDCIGTWLTAQLDLLNAWQRDRGEWAVELEATLTELADAIASSAHDLVIVSNEVGLALVPEHRSGRVFADWLGLSNQRIAAVCDEVQLVVAGQVLKVKG